MSYTWFHDLYPRARTAHRCELCGLPIVKGEIHTARVGAEVGGPSTFRMHNLCEAYTVDLGSEWWERRPDPGEFRTDLLRWLAATRRPHIINL